MVIGRSHSLRVAFLNTNRHAWELSKVPQRENHFLITLYLFSLFP